VSFDEYVYNSIQRAAIDNGTLHVESYIKVLVLRCLSKELDGRPQGWAPKLGKDLMN